MTIDGVDGANGKDGADGLDIVWKGDLSTPPANPVKNWVYRDTDNGRVYIYNGTAWALMVADGNDGTNGAAGTNGLSVYITYHDSESQPAVPTGNGTSDGWHTNATNAVVWMSQKVAESASSGSWGTPIRAKGTDGEDAVLYIFEFEQDGKVINSIPAFADETPKFQSDIIFKLYKIAGSDKQLCADYYLYVQIFNNDGSNYINEHNNLSSQYQFSSAYGVSYTVFATTGTHQTGDRIIEASISKVMDGQQGLPGSDANVPDWVKEWDTGKTQIGSEYMISPKLFTGKNTGTAEEPILTGIVQGDKCITIDGVERSGIFALVDNEVIFELDPENRKYKFNGEVNATSGVFKNIKSPNDSFRIKENGEIEIVGKISTSSNGTRIEIDPVTNSLKMYTQDGIEVGSLSFFESEWNGIINYLPRLRLRRYVDNVLYNETSIDSGTIFCSQKVGSDDYSCYLIPSNGLTFYKNNEQTKHYSKS